MKNYYELLEVDRNASANIIKAVYKIHIKKKHPDLFQGEEKIKAEEELKKLNEAYEVLSDEGKRKEYDKTLQDEEIDKKLFDEILQENIMLREILDGRNQKLESNSNSNNVVNNNFEYEPTPYETEQNNTKYLMKLIWKERMLRLVIVSVFVIAISVSIFKVTGINIFESFWNAFSNIFTRNI